MRRSSILVVIASALPVIILGSAFWTASLNTQQRALEQLASDRARFASALIERELAAQVRSVQMVAQSPAFDRGLDSDRFALLAARLVADEPSWRALSVADPSGLRILDSPEPIAGKPGGRVVDADSLSRTVSGRRPVIGKVVTGPRGRPGFAVRAPIVRGGQVTHVVTAVVDPQALTPLLLSEGLPPGWTAEVLDPAGTVVASTLREPPARRTGERKRLARGEGFVRISAPGEPESVVTFQPVKGVEWTVRVGMPAAVYGAPARQASQVLAAGALVSVLLSAVLAGLLMQNLRRRRAEDVAADQHQRLEALGRMTGGVAHDFNNLLTPVLGGLDMLRRRVGDDPRSVRLIEGALQSAERAKTLVDRLLTFARRQSLQTSDVDVGGLIRGLAELIDQTSGPGLHLTLRVAKDLPCAKVDAGQLELAILNLALNGRDAMASGGVLTIAAERRSGGEAIGARLARGDYVRIAVTDTGAGMDAATLRQAVDPFFTTKAAGRGTGLGLSMVHGLAAQSGGALILNSKPGVGTTAEIWLPASASVPAPSETAEPAIADIRTGVLLLVDDDEVVRATTAEILADHGHTVLEAGSVTEALRLLRTDTRIEAVVTDYAMPLRSGAELIEDARVLRPGIPMLLITGYAVAAAEVPAEVPRLRKPFRRAALLNAVATLLSEGVASA